MDIATQRAWSLMIARPHRGTRHVRMLLAGVAITVTAVVGMYAAAAMLATRMAATFTTEETDWRAEIVELAPAAKRASTGRGGESMAERSSLGMGSVRWQTDGTDASL